MKDILTIGFILVFIGILLIIVGMLVHIGKSAKSEKAEVKGGGVILIGPIPIVFGTDVESVKWVILLTIVLILLVFFLFYRGG